MTSRCADDEGGCHMKFVFSVVLTVVLLPLLACGQSEKAELNQAQSETVTAALKILDAYHAANPKPGDRKLHVICWRPSDREFPADKQGRLTRILEHIQKFYGDEMERLGFGHRTIQFDYDDEKNLVIHEAIGAGKYADYKKADGQKVKADCVPVLKEAGINPDRETVVIFTNLSDWDPEKKTFVHKSPYYAGGNYRGGTAWQLDSVELDTKNLGLKEPIISDGEYGKISLGKHNSIFIGGVAHELGHSLGLPHCRERRDEKEAFGTALMGSGNRTYFDQLRSEGRGSFLTLAHGLRLASHPQFSGSVKGMNQPTRATYSEIAVKEVDEHFSVSGKITSPVPVYALVAYLDPEGGGDYDSRTVCTVPDASGKFSLDCYPLQRGKESSQIRVVALMANGATSTWESSFGFRPKGVLDISLMKITIGLADFIEALRNNQIERAKEIAAEFPKDDVRKDAALRLLEAQSPDRKTKNSGEISDSEKSFPLSAVTPAEASVGWGEPAYDFIPEGKFLIVSGGQLFQRGIYAHAPARHVYEFPEGHSWKRLTGKFGLPEQRGGSVVFVIKVDGKEVFRSQLVKPGQIYDIKKGESSGFSVSIEAAKKLELITEDGGDGTAVDWGLWLAPTLNR